jgi:hypothetical protein
MWIKTIHLRCFLQPHYSGRALPAATEPAKSQLERPITAGLMARTQRLLSSGNFFTADVSPPIAGAGFIVFFRVQDLQRRFIGMQHIACQQHPVH